MSISKVGANYAAIVERAADIRKAAQQKSSSGVSDSTFKMDALDDKLQGGGGNKLGAALAKVSDIQNGADSMVIDLASGKDVNLHNTMIELEKADIALKYTVQLRNRALNAYEELMRLQV